MHISLLALLALIQFGQGAMISEILRTPQFMLISQYQCETTFEVTVQDQKCPQTLAITPRKIFCATPVRIHLARDPSGVHEPWLIYVGADFGNNVVAFAEKLEKPPSTNESVVAYKTKVVTMSGKNSKSSFLNVNVKYPEISATLYDSDSRLLYVITNRPGKGIYCSMFYVKNLFSLPGASDRVQFDWIKDFIVHNNNQARTDWSVDPYSKEVYYVTQHETKTIHAAPISELMPILQEGISGKVALTLEDTQPRSHFRISGGALFMYKKHADQHYSYARSLYSRDKGMYCKTHDDPNIRIPAVLSTVVVRDDDYCLLQHGRGADLKACAEERDAWKKANGFDEETGTGGIFLWLLIAFFILLAFVILLCVCVCCMKRNMEAAYADDLQHGHPPIPYYATNNPTGYLDCSVDAWNTMNNNYKRPIHHDIE